MARWTIGIACALLVAAMPVDLALANAKGARNDVTQGGGGQSCTSFFQMCAQRCRIDNPSDKACVADHCAPKQATCNTTGCWTEGKRYGGRQTCSLKP